MLRDLAAAYSPAAYSPAAVAPAVVAHRSDGTAGSLALGVVHLRLAHVAVLAACPSNIAPILDPLLQSGNEAHPRTSCESSGADVRVDSTPMGSGNPVPGRSRPNDRPRSKTKTLAPREARAVGGLRDMGERCECSR